MQTSGYWLIWKYVYSSMYEESEIISKYLMLIIDCEILLCWYSNTEGILFVICSRGGDHIMWRSKDETWLYSEPYY
jgi:hypothetical protein